MNNHVTQSKVVNGAEIWPQEAHMLSENLLICRVVCLLLPCKRSGGVGIWQLSEEALRHILQLSSTSAHHDRKAGGRVKRMCRHVHMI
jgi:hypothetical protein